MKLYSGILIVTLLTSHLLGMNFDFQLNLDDNDSEALLFIKEELVPADLPDVRFTRLYVALCEKAPTYKNQKALSDHLEHLKNNIIPYDFRIRGFIEQEIALCNPEVLEILLAKFPHLLHKKDILRLNTRSAAIPGRIQMHRKIPEIDAIIHNHYQWLMQKIKHRIHKHMQMPKTLFSRLPKELKNRLLLFSFNAWQHYSLEEQMRILSAASIAQKPWWKF